MKKGISICCLVVGLVVFSTAGVMAQGGNIHVGELKVVLGLGAQTGYDSNIYLGSGINSTTEREESDWITQFSPSVLVDYPLRGRGNIQLGYRADLAFYRDNTENDWQGHTGTLGLNYQAPSGLILGINNTYTKTEDPYSAGNEYLLGVPQVKRWYNDFKTTVGYSFSDKLRALGYFNFYKQDYDNDRDYTQDYKDKEFGVGVEMRVMPKTWGFFRLHVGDREYFTYPAGTGVTQDNDAASEWHRVNAGLKWDTGAKVIGELNFGYQWRSYNNTRDPAGNLYDDKNTWIASTLLFFEATPRTTFGFSLLRAVRDTGSSTNEYYEDTGFGFTVKQQFLRKFTFDAGASYSQNDYNAWAGSPREDDNYKAAVGIDYQIRKWLSAGLSFNYWRKDSTAVAEEFADNRLLFSLNLAY